MNNRNPKVENEMADSSEQPSTEKLLKNIDTKLTILNGLLIVLIVAIISPPIAMIVSAAIGALVIASLIGIGIARLIRRSR
jgi:hypothetical protein